MTANIQRHMRHSSSRNASRNASRNVSVAPEQKISTGHNENIGEANVSQRVSIDDEEKTRPVAQTPSHGAGKYFDIQKSGCETNICLGYDLNGNVLDIDGEYVVTAKTWAVVTVSNICARGTCSVSLLTNFVGSGFQLWYILLACSMLVSHVCIHRQTR